MNLFLHELDSYVYEFTASAIGLQAGVMELYWSCIYAGAPNWAERISPSWINPLSYHSIASTCYDLQLAQLKGK